jgi:hypothetical protein
LTNDSLPDNIFYSIRLRQPGYRDTLFQSNFLTDNSHISLDSASTVMFDSIVKQWPTWTEDSANVVVFLKGLYYCCDSDSDTLLSQRIEHAMLQLETLSKQFEKKGIKCNYIMQDLDMIIYDDEEDLFDQIECKIVEFY